MFGSYFTNHKVLNSNSNGSLFVSRRQSNSKNEMSTKEESSRCYNDQKQRNTSRKNSSEVRASYSSLTISQQSQPQQSSQGMQMGNQLNDEKPEYLRNSFYNQKSHSNSSKQMNDNGFSSSSVNGGGSMFFQKSNFESKILQKKMNEGQLLSMQNQKAFTVGNYNAGTSSQLNLSKFKIMLEQSNSLRTSSNHQQFFKNDTDRYATDNKETIESFHANGTEHLSEKENNKYFFSQFTKKNKNTQESTQQNSNQTPLYQGTEVEECNLQVIVKSPTKNIGNQLTTTTSQYTIDSANILESQQSVSQLMTSQKSKNLQDMLKIETEKDSNKSIGSGEIQCGTQKHMSSQQLNDFFNSKKSLSPRKVVKEASQMQSPQYRHQNSERKPIINSPDIKNSKSFENIFTNNPTSIQKFTSFHQNLQAFTSSQKPKQQTSNGNGSLQSSFQVKNELAQSTNMDEKQATHYFTKDQDTVLNSAKKQSTHSNTINLAGSIVNLKKSKKKPENQQINVHSSIDSEMSLMRMENFNLKNQNQVLAMKNETLEKEKKHYKNLCSKKQQEVDLLNEQLSSLRNQIDQMKIQIKLSTHSQESTLIQKPLAQTLLSTHNMSSQETPRQLTSSTNNNLANQQTSPNFQPQSQNFSQQSSYAASMLQQNNCNSQLKQQQQLIQNAMNIQQQQNQIQLIQQQQLNQQLQQNTLQTQYQQQIKQTLMQSQNNQQYQHQNYQNTEFFNINTQSPQKNNNYSNHGQAHKNGLSPIVNSEERSDFVSNSILEDIPTTQSQIRTINNSLIIQHSHVNDDFEIIQSEYMPSHHNHSTKHDSHFNTLQHPQNLKF